MQLHVFSFEQRSAFEAEYKGFLALRKLKLVDELGWGLAHDGTYEKDQYDRVGAVYSIVTRCGRVIAGARAVSCGGSDGQWSYMLKDAEDGKIPGIPGTLLSDYPGTSETWECTRFVMDETRADASQRSVETKLVVAGLCLASFRLEASELISLSPPGLGALLRRFGYKVRREAARYTCEDDGREYRVFRMMCEASVNRSLAARYLSPGSASLLRELRQVA
ncbi:acyl-homoserine-lactone synthase [Leisingera thetidis]|uniref:acyl-homoserine-lactone synthase n=1 Tax=Leisingera thetidis TaxID=2930199 RepID=UPI0021F7AE43|nr:acyl-homoserine-lactone synthase [Leisingera thetidis]